MFVYLQGISFPLTGLKAEAKLLCVYCKFIPMVDNRLGNVLK